MSARMEIERSGWEAKDRAAAEDASIVEMESLFRNADQKNLVAPLREARATLTQAQRPAWGNAQFRAAVALQEQWNTWEIERDLLNNEIKRGRELLEEVQRELLTLRGRLEEWAAFERICGKNPISEYVQSIAAKERIEQFLPAWLRRREAKLKALNRQMELYAKKNGLEHTA